MGGKNIKISNGVEKKTQKISNPVRNKFLSGANGVKLQFLYSKIKEKEKLFDLYDEYQWFIDNNFPITLPKFYAKIYQENKNNKKLFIGKLNKEFNKIYNENIYQPKTERIKNNWQKMEKKVFNILKRLGLKAKNKYICYISLYGPLGQFKCPNIINLRVSSSKDIKEANRTITHELIHLLIYKKAKKLKLNYKQIEGVVDSFFLETDLKKIFPGYKRQKIAIYRKGIFKKAISPLPRLSRAKSRGR